jgi:Protein of unknown function (DUF732)
MQPTTIAAALMTSAVLLISSMPLAHADPQDDTYLNELAAQGITQYPSDKLITVGHAVCAYEANGAAPWQIQNGLIGSGIAPQDIDAVVKTATNTYCR